MRGDSHLHTPVHLFLSSLSFVDVCYSSAVAPEMLSDFFRGQKSISFRGCAAQVFSFEGAGLTERLLLTAMACDRPAATSRPRPTPPGLLSSLVPSSSIFRLRCCGPNLTDHFFCDLPPVLALSCSDTFSSQAVNFLAVAVVGGTSFLSLLVSYGPIVATVLKIRWVEGRRKGLHTCASHVMAVTQLLGRALFMYLRPSSSYSFGRHKVVSVFYSLVIPMLNPLIYSLRNKEIKDALRKMLGKKKVFS
ncbi:hypothetical protein FD755_017769 [Muntiacus reevesi]|uniref:G-protein coupled receptors family 1 profile domain-containing protein n=1 Tax=Muntiacus reevesi TaxID=9886 RepID=A0A5N3XE29_MUNRE|nr:hypothetical protein FD755_017769 [Muntiacus reevesi]